MSARAAQWAGRVAVVLFCRGPPQFGCPSERRKTGSPPGLPQHRRLQRRTKTISTASVAGERTDPQPARRSGPVRSR